MAVSPGVENSIVKIKNRGRPATCPAEAEAQRGNGDRPVPPRRIQQCALPKPRLPKSMKMNTNSTSTRTIAMNRCDEPAAGMIEQSLIGRGERI